jgi:hypothetical protein
MTRVEEQIQWAHLHWLLYAQVRDAEAARHPDANHVWVNSYGIVYSQAQIMTIRRLADTDEEAHSLWSLLDAIRRNPSAITATDFADLWVARHDGDKTDRSQATESFRARYGRGQDTLALDLIETDQFLIRNDLRMVLDYADQVVAHLDPNGVERQLTFAEIHAAIRGLSDICSRYSFLLTGGDEISFEYLYVPPTWKEPLRLSLFPND